MTETLCFIAASEASFYPEIEVHSWDKKKIARLPQPLGTADGSGLWVVPCESIALWNFLHSDRTIAGCSFACPIKEMISCLPTESVVICNPKFIVLT